MIKVSDHKYKRSKHEVIKNQHIYYDKCHYHRYRNNSIPLTRCYNGTFYENCKKFRYNKKFKDSIRHLRYIYNEGLYKMRYVRLADESGDYEYEEEIRIKNSYILYCKIKQTIKLNMLRAKGKSIWIG